MITLNNATAKIINNAAASIEMEGFVVTSEYKALCEKLLNKEITMAEYIEQIKKSQGIVA